MRCSRWSSPTCWPGSFRQPFVTGDQIAVADLRGTVEGITIRETRVRTFQGHLAVVTNKDVSTTDIDVQTNREHVRTDLVVAIEDAADLGVARELAMGPGGPTFARPRTA